MPNMLHVLLGLKVDKMRYIMFSIVLLISSIFIAPKGVLGTLFLIPILFCFGIFLLGLKQFYMLFITFITTAVLPLVVLIMMHILSEPKVRIDLTEISIKEWLNFIGPSILMIILIVSYNMAGNCRNANANRLGKK